MIKFKPTFVAFAVAALTFAGSASAGLVGVKDIVVTKTAGSTQYIQVSELQAFQTGTGTNVALSSNGGTASAPSTWDGNSTPSKAIDGQFSDLTFPNMFHNAGNVSGEFLKISLAAVSELDSLAIYGRSDACCSFRDIFDISFFGLNGDLLYTATGIDASGATHMATLDLPDTNDVPEPASLLLLGAGLAGIARIRRNRK